MRPIRLALAAEDDLFDIWSFIASDNLEAADRLQTELLAACQRVADRPDLGHWRRHITDKPVRVFPVRQTYLVVYDPASDPLVIIRILHGSRDVSVHLDE